MSHARAEGLRVAALSKQCVMRARTGSSVLAISFSASQYSLADNGLHSLSLLEMPAPEGHLRDHFQSSNGCLRHTFKEPQYASTPICLLYFPVCPGVANALSPVAWGGRAGRGLALAADHCQVDSKHRARRLVFIPPPSVSGRSKGQKFFRFKNSGGLRIHNGMGV